MNATPLIFFDLETAGLNPKRHPIIQIAAIAVDAHLAPLEAFEAKIRFDHGQANRRSLRKNHYSRAAWEATALPPREAALALAQFLRRHTKSPSANHLQVRGLAQLVAHNAAFDGPFLHTWYERLGLFCPAKYQVLCTLQRAQWYFTEQPVLPRPRNFQLATLCQYFRVPFHAADAHEALGDVTATVGLYRALRASTSAVQIVNPRAA